MLLHQAARSGKALSKRSRPNERKRGSGRVCAGPGNIGDDLIRAVAVRDRFRTVLAGGPVIQGASGRGRIGTAFRHLPADDSSRANPNAAGRPSKFRNRRRRCFSTASSLRENLRATCGIQRKRRLRARSARPWLKPFGTSGDDGGKRGILHPAKGAEGRAALALV